MATRRACVTPPVDGLDQATRTALHTALRTRHPWLADADLVALGVGPAAVEAGECDRCGVEPRLVEACGPGPVGLGRACAVALGPEGWCAGHRDDAEAALAALTALPPEADAVARLWWVATGEVHVDPARLVGLQRAVLGPGGC